MSLIYGEIRQLGYVVHDIEATMRHWIDALGVGPWFYVERYGAKNFLYRGQPSDLYVSIAIANSGGTQIELIQPRNDAPSMYRDFLASGPEGLQHVSTWPVDYEATIERALKSGYGSDSRASRTAARSPTSIPKARIVVRAWRLRPIPRCASGSSMPSRLRRATGTAAIRFERHGRSRFALVASEWDATIASRRGCRRRSCYGRGRRGPRGRGYTGSARTGRRHA